MEVFSHHLLSDTICGKMKKKIVRSKKVFFSVVIFYSKWLDFFGGIVANVFFLSSYTFYCVSYSAVRDFWPLLKILWACLLTNSPSAAHTIGLKWKKIQVNLIFNVIIHPFLLFFFFNLFQKWKIWVGRYFIATNKFCALF